MCARLTVLSSVGTLLLMSEKLLATHMPVPVAALLSDRCSVRRCLIRSPASQVDETM